MAMDLWLCSNGAVRLPRTCSLQMLVTSRPCHSAYAHGLELAKEHSISPQKLLEVVTIPVHIPRLLHCSSCKTCSCALQISHELLS